MTWIRWGTAATERRMERPNPHLFPFGSENDPWSKISVKNTQKLLEYWNSVPTSNARSVRDRRHVDPSAIGVNALNQQGGRKSFSPTKCRSTLRCNLTTNISLVDKFQVVDQHSVCLCLFPKKDNVFLQKRRTIRTQVTLVNNVFSPSKMLFTDALQTLV